VQALTPPNPFTISDMSRVWIICDVWENNMAQVHIGEYADIHLVAYPDRVLKGRISNILPIVDPNIRTAKVRLEVENPGLMRVGMFVTATFHGETTERHATCRPPRFCTCTTASGSTRRWETAASGARKWSPGTCCPTTCRRSSRDQAGRPGGGQRAGLPEHGGAGAVNDSPSRRFRPGQPLSRFGARSCCSSGRDFAFHQLPVEAYPDVADNYVEIVTQWPGISAEQMEQQITIPLEIVMNGMPHVTHLRSFSLFGLSDIKLIFDDEEENAWDRERALERLSQVSLPPAAVAAGVSPQMQTDWSPAGQIYFFTLHSTNPAYDVMELKSLEDWVVEKNFKAVPNIVDVASFGGPTREYQVRVDPDKLISYGLSIGQVEQQLTNNNANAGGSFVEAGLQQINIREVGLVKNVTTSKTP
jgi:hypothetical protein